MPAQPTIRADQRSAYDRQPGAPWWGAVLIAVTMTLAGLGIEAGLGHQELGSPFAITYSLGCVLAVLTVRQSGIFTAVIQPPLLLFVAVPLAYYLLHKLSFTGLKEIAITCGYPLIERFPLMLFTTSAVLLIGLVRWYLGMSGTSSRAAQPAGLLAGLSTKLSSAFAGTGSVDEVPGRRAARPRHAGGRPSTATRSRKPQERASEGSRRPRRADEAIARQRGDSRRRDAERGAEPRRRSGEPRDPRRGTPPPRRDQRDRRDYRDHREYLDPYPPRPARGSRYEPYESNRDYRGYQSHQAYPTHPGYPPPDPRQARRPAPSGGSHHPVSRVRYRDSGPSDADYRPR